VTQGKWPADGREFIFSKNQAKRFKTKKRRRSSGSGPCAACR
jgi:hypothetical protein